LASKYSKSSRTAKLIQKWKTAKPEQSMSQPKISRPQFPKGYVDAPTSSLTWDYVVKRLSESKNYWLCSVRPNARPHVVPRWGVFVDEKFYYDGSPETRHALNLHGNPEVALHLESGDEALIVEGCSRAAGKPDPDLAQKLAAAYCAKYEQFGYAPQPDQWDQEGLFVFTPRKVLVWTKFMEDPTRFELEEG
jgi:hypothetical protein